ncbi:MAG: OprO/OprP family phosphate-selective porin [Oleiphilaceae bacterium]|nr:OprO/OprP family phosphate-selective porin [Oleiphilaceae bacterium]
MKKHQQWKVTALAAIIGASAAGNAFAAPEFSPRGRVHVDVALHDEDVTELGDSMNTRRARLGVDGKLDDQWDFIIEYDFAEEGVAARDVYLRYRLPMGRLIIGQTKVPMGLSESTSSNNITFIERASNNNAFNDAFRLGLSYHLSQDNFTFQSMVYSRAIGDEKEAGDSQIGFGNRFVFNPINQGTQVVHLGASVAYEDLGDQLGVRYRERPEARPAGVRLIDTGSLDDVTDTFKYGLEAAYKNGPFSAEAEYLNVDADRILAEDPSFSGYHVQASYVLTGESRGYSGGKFGGIKPQDPAGAWEVAARFSSVDLDDSGVTGGKQDNITLGLNYYATSKVRFMANLIQADIEGGVNGDEKPKIALFRAQYSF